MAATRTKFQRERDLEYISNLYLQGVTQQRIAQKLATERDYEVSRVTIANDLKEVNRRWQLNTTLPLDEHKSKELARIDLLEQTYWIAWEKSLAQSESTTQRTKDTPVTRKDEKGKPVQSMSKQYEASIRKEERDGNPAFLAGVERCIKMRMDLLGLNAPVKVENSGTVTWEIVREDDHSRDRPKNQSADVTPGTEDYLQ